jgi:hypothetical protein
MSSIKRLVFFLLAIGIGVSLVVNYELVAQAATFTQVVTEAQIVRQAENTPPTKNWVLYTRNAGDGAFRSGPGSPPLGIGSIEFSTPTGNDKVTLFNFDHVTTRISDIEAIKYSTYRTASLLDSDVQVAALNLQVDANGPDAPGGFTTLVFEPVYNTSQGSLVDGQWQNWDAINGGAGVWWSSNPIPGLPNRDTFVTWSTVVASNPEATIVGGFGINQGSGNPSLTSAVDKLSIGYDGDLITYDFEPLLEATSKDQCKAGGWAYVSRADDTLFKNQGDCVSYVSAGK